jgi:hypothetical protein
MNLSDQLLVDMSRKNADYILHYLNNDPKLFKELLDIMFNGSPPLPHRASWIVTLITDKYPELFKPYLKKIISYVENCDNSSIRRNLLRSIAEYEIPEPLQGKLFDYCYKWLQSRFEPPAVKVHCMEILYNISQGEPDLKNELKLILEELSNHESPAVKSRCGKLLMKLKK